MNYFAWRPSPFIILPLSVQVAERYGTSYDQTKRPPLKHPSGSGSGDASARAKPSAADALPDRKWLPAFGRVMHVLAFDLKLMEHLHANSLLTLP